MPRVRVAAKSVSDPNNLPAVLSPAGVSCKLASLKQARALIRLALRSSAHTEGVGVRIRSRVATIQRKGQRTPKAILWADMLNALPVKVDVCALKVHVGR